MFEVLTSQFSHRAKKISARASAHLALIAHAAQHARTSCDRGCVAEARRGACASEKNEDHRLEK
jgi:hypothetical protein